MLRLSWIWQELWNPHLLPRQGGVFLPYKLSALQMRLIFFLSFTVFLGILCLPQIAFILVLSFLLRVVAMNISCI